MIEENTQIALPMVCVINKHGRFIDASKSFTKSLSLKHDDVSWHYFCSYVRNNDEKNAFQVNLLAEKDFELKARIKRRSGKSYPATLSVAYQGNNRYQVELHHECNY